MDALELLKQDHQKVKKLLTSATETEDKNEQKRLFKEIKTELETHARLEETIFYPAVREHKELASMVFESLEEHRQVKLCSEIWAELPPAATNSRLNSRS